MIMLYRSLSSGWQTASLAHSIPVLHQGHSAVLGIGEWDMGVKLAEWNAVGISVSYLSPNGALCPRNLLPVDPF